MESTVFVVACPKGFVTGGPECLHQLVNAINSLGSVAVLWDPEESRSDAIPAKEYESYGCTWDSEGPKPGDVVVFPEVMTELIPKYYSKNLCVIWWLSVDNFISTSQLPIEVIRECYPDLIHCYQSEYARNFIEMHELGNQLALSDYTNLDFITFASTLKRHECDQSSKKIVAINPAKGFERTEIVIKKFPSKKFLRLENMSRPEVMDALASSTYYLDLGTHPGKDRFPREAALLNCIVLTNTRGASDNDIDIPIDVERFKIDDSLDGFELELLSIVEAMDFNICTNLEMQSTYRNKITNEKKVFDEEVTKFIESIEVEISLVDVGIRNSLLDTHNFMMKVIQERDSALLQVAEMNKSMSWKVTQPIRFCLDLFKNLYKH